MLAWNLRYKIKTERLNVDISEAPVIILEPFNYIKVEVSGNISIPIPEYSNIQHIKVIRSSAVEELDPHLWEIQEDMLNVFNPFEDIKGLLIIGFSYPNPVFKEATERLGKLGSYLAKSFLGIEFCFRVRDTFYILKKIAAERYVGYLANLLLGYPYARTSGTIIHLYDIPEGVEVWYKTEKGEVFYEKVPMSNEVKNRVSVQVGQKVERGQPLCNLVKVQSDHHTINLSFANIR